MKKQNGIKVLLLLALLHAFQGCSTFFARFDESAEQRADYFPATKVNLELEWFDLEILVDPFIMPLIVTDFCSAVTLDTLFLPVDALRVLNRKQKKVGVTTLAEGTELRQDSLSPARTQ